MTGTLREADEEASTVEFIDIAGQLVRLEAPGPVIAAITG